MSEDTKSTCLKEVWIHVLCLVLDPIPHVVEQGVHEDHGVHVGTVWLLNDPERDVEPCLLKEDVELVNSGASGGISGLVGKNESTLLILLSKDEKIFLK